METKSILEKFKRQRKLLNNLRENTATSRLKGMWNFLNSKAEMVSIIYGVPTIEHLVAKAGPNKTIAAATEDEIIGVGLYIMKKCSESNDHINLIINHLGLGLKSINKNENQIYVDELKGNFIDPALDFVEEKLKELATTESKTSKESNTSRITDAKNEEEKSGSEEGQGGEFKDVYQLSEAFIKFLVEKKDYPKSCMERVEKDGGVDGRGIDEGTGLYLRIRDHETHKQLAIVEFGLNENNSTIKMARQHFDYLNINAAYADIEGYAVFPIAAGLGEEFSVIKFDKGGKGYENLLYEDFPTYEELRKRVDPETETTEGEGSDDEDMRNAFRENFISFLINEKKFPRESLNHGIVAEAPDKDLAVAHPDTDDSLAVFDCKSGNHGKPSPEVSESMAKTYKSGLSGIQNPFAYIVHPSEESNEDFMIFEVEDDGGSNEISYEDFPTYYQLLFASPLSNKGRRISSNLIRLAKDKHGFSVHSPCEDYINLQIKKDGRNAAQIHRVNDSDDNIAFALAGYQEYFPEAKLPNYMFRGEVKQLSGYTNKYPGERNWLEGNLGHQKLIYEAGVYILRPGSLVDGEVENEVGGLLELAKKNAEKDKEPEEKKVSRYGKGHIATIQMDMLSEVDLLGRDKLVKAFAGMFAHTKEVEGFTVALLGDWGEGKSTLMKLLKGNLNEKHPGRFEFATFNAWEYERTDNIAAGLAQEVVNGLLEPLQKQCRDRQKLRFKFALKEYKGELCRLAIYSLVAILIIFISHVFFENNTLKGLGLAGGIAALIFLLFKSLPTIIEHPIAIKLETYLKLPNYGEHLGDIPIIQSHLKTLCSLRLVDNKKLIVFIDDLDRCQTDCIARALDAIRLVMSMPNVIVMIGIDYRIAFKAMENYYEKLGDKERNKSEIARDYLGKIIQLPVRLMSSNPEEVRKYIEKRLFPDAQVLEDVKEDEDIDKKVIEPPKPLKGIKEGDRDDKGDHIPDAQKVEEPKSVEEILKDTTIERDMFYNLAKRFSFTNPRQLLRLRNSYRFLKVMDPDEKYDREILMKILFWHEFLNNWPSIIRDQCEKSVEEQESLVKIEKPEAIQIVKDVREDILKIIELPMYEEIKRFVHIVVLPHSEGG